jgi:hypothetical protein
MTYEETWKVLSDLLVELRKRGETIPTDVVEDLRSAKTMIQVLKADPSYIENIPKIETFLGKVESHLVFLAQEKVGSSFVDKWMERLDRARRAVAKEREVAPRFISGLPRGEHWVRVKVSKDTPRKDLERLAEEKNLSHKTRKNGYMLVSGDSEGIKSFVKTMAERFRSARGQ